MIDHHSDRAAYKQLADAVREQIASGELAAGAEMPSFPALALQYSVSIDVVKDAIGVLRNEGLLEVSRGRKAHVRPDRAIEVVAAPPHARVSTRMPTPTERTALEIGDGIPILIVRWAYTETIYAGDRSEVLLQNG